MDGRLVHRATGLHVPLNDSEKRLLEALIVTRTLSKDEVLERVWRAKGIVVSDSSYYKLVSTLRRKFRTLSEAQEFIRVIPRLGLELCCTLTPAAPQLAHAGASGMGASDINAVRGPEGWLARRMRHRPFESWRTFGQLFRRLRGRLAWSLAALVLLLLLSVMAVIQIRVIFAA